MNFRYHLNRTHDYTWQIFDLQRNKITEGIEFKDFERAMAFCNYLNRTYQLSESRRAALMKTFSEDELAFGDLMISDQELDNI